LSASSSARADANDVHAGVVVAQFGRRARRNSASWWALRHFLQGLVALAVHAAEVGHQSLHLAVGRVREAVLAVVLGGGHPGFHGVLLPSAVQCTP
jgi:hypothetical protein